MKAIDNEFREFEFDSSELSAILGAVSNSFLYFLKTRRTELCRERLALEIDVNDVSAFIQTEAAIKGGIAELECLIQAIEAANLSTTSKE